MNKKILFIGDLNFYSKGSPRSNACRRLGYQLKSLSHTPIGGSNLGYVTKSLLFRIAWKLKIHLDTEKINSKIVASVKSFKPHILWIEKGNMIRPRTLKEVKRVSPKTSIISYSDDNMFNPLNHTRSYKNCLKYYHKIFTTKSLNVNSDELPSLGANKVVMIDKGYDLEQHFPITLSDKEKIELGSDVSFIGTYAPEREKILKYLAHHNIKIRVWGNGWEGFKSNDPNLVIEYRPLVNHPNNLSYTKGVAATKINLGFLRKINKDLQTDRSIEIPACGGFLLAERSTEHERLFIDGKEAVFFDNKTDLLKKIKYFLVNHEQRKKIAEAGRKRCETGNYSYDSRMESMFALILKS